MKQEFVLAGKSPIKQSTRKILHIFQNRCKLHGMSTIKAGR